MLISISLDKTPGPAGICITFAAGRKYAGCSVKNLLTVAFNGSRLSVSRYVGKFRLRDEWYIIRGKLIIHFRSKTTNIVANRRGSDNSERYALRRQTAPTIPMGDSPR